MISTNELTAYELLTTTRAVRRRLDLTRPVDRRAVEECLSIAQQAPNAGNRQVLHFVVVTKKETRASLADIYRRGAAGYFESLRKGSGYLGKDTTMKRVLESALYLNEHLREVPVHVIPCISGRTENATIPTQAARWGSIFPAVWSFMLAGRTKGLGMTLTTLHLNREEEAAELLGIPFRDVMQACLLPVAHVRGSKFRVATRPSLSDLIHWEQW